MKDNHETYPPDNAAQNRLVRPVADHDFRGGNRFPARDSPDLSMSNPARNDVLAVLGLIGLSAVVMGALWWFSIPK